MSIRMACRNPPVFSTFRFQTVAFSTRIALRKVTTTTSDHAKATIAQISESKPKADLKVQEPKFKIAKKPTAKRLVPPKRPWSIMQLVIQNVVAEQKAIDGASSSVNVRDCFRRAGEKYRALTEDERAAYQVELDRRRQVYEVEMQTFLDSLTPQDYVNQNEYIRRRRAQGRSAARKGIPKLDPNAPKRPLNAFMLFCADLRANPTKFEDFPGFSPTSSTSLGEGSRALAAHWRELKEDVKQGYMSEAQRLREVYKQERELYEGRSKPSIS